VNIPAWGIGALLLFMDLIAMNTAGFGGTSAAFLMMTYFS
jgi:hypothetical protein